jgi:hypothetical protein
MQAEALIAHLATAVDADSPGSYLEMEVARIRSRPSSYLAHEFLEPENRAFLLHEFVADASTAGLRYLCNADLATGYPELYGALGEAMAGCTDDPVRVEQYLDFVANRAFRQSLLCRDDEPATGLDHTRLQHLHLSADLAATPKPELRRNRPQTFTTRDGTDFDVQHPVSKAALAELAGHPVPGITCATLLDSAAQRVRAQGDPHNADPIDEALDELFSLVVMQHIEPLLEPPRQNLQRSGRPRASRLALQQAGLGWSHLATVLHRCLELDDFARALVLQLDGTRDSKTLQQAMLDWLRLHADLDDQALRGARRNVENNVSRLLKLFARHGILEQL